MTLNDIVFQMFRRVIWKLLRGFLGPLGGFPGAWRPLGGLLGASWIFFGLLEVDLKLNTILDGLDFSEGLSWSRLAIDFLVFGGHFGAIFEGYSATVVTATWACKIDDLPAF